MSKPNILATFTTVGVVSSIIVYKILTKPISVEALKKLPNNRSPEKVDNNNLTDYLNKHKYVLLPCVLILIISVAYLISTNSLKEINSANTSISDKETVKSKENPGLLEPQEENKDASINPTAEEEIDASEEISQEGFLNIFNGVYFDKNTSVNNIFYGLLIMAIIHGLIGCWNIEQEHEEYIVKDSDDFFKNLLSRKPTLGIFSIFKSYTHIIFYSIIFYSILYGILYYFNLSLPSSCVLNIIYVILVSLLSNKQFCEKLESLKLRKWLTISRVIHSEKCPKKDISPCSSPKFVLIKNTNPFEDFHNSLSELLACQKCYEKLQEDELQNVTEFCQTHRQTIYQYDYSLISVDYIKPLLISVCVILNFALMYCNMYDPSILFIIMIPLIKQKLDNEDQNQYVLSLLILNGIFALAYYMYIPYMFFLSVIVINVLLSWKRSLVLDTDVLLFFLSFLLFHLYLFYNYHMCFLIINILFTLINLSLFLKNTIFASVEELIKGSVIDEGDAGTFNRFGLIAKFILNPNTYIILIEIASSCQQTLITEYKTLIKDCKNLCLIFVDYIKSLKIDNKKT